MKSKYSNIFNKQFLIFLFFIQLVFIYNLGILPFVEAIIGQGFEEADSNDYPSVVAVLAWGGPESQVEDNVVCGATLISRDHIVTAEHCLYEYNGSYVVFIIGSNDIRDGLKRFPMWWLSHDQWAATFNIQTDTTQNDVAVVRFTRRSPMHIIPAVISQETLTEMVGCVATMLGWGRTNNGTHPRYLQKAVLFVLNRQQCNQIASVVAGVQIQIPEAYFCSVRTPYILMGNGDSGGPTFNEHGHLIGVNAGNCPRYHNQFHPDKSNLILAVAYYSNFVNFALSE